MSELNLQQKCLAKIDDDFKLLDIDPFHPDNPEIINQWFRALRSVIVQHKMGSDTDDIWCDECGEFRYYYPCPTMTEIAKEMGIE